MSSYVFIFHQLVDVLEELPGHLNKNHMDNVLTPKFGKLSIERRESADSVKNKKIS